MHPHSKLKELESKLSDIQEWAFRRGQHQYEAVLVDGVDAHHLRQYYRAIRWLIGTADPAKLNLKYILDNLRPLGALGADHDPKRPDLSFNCILQTLDREIQRVFRIGIERESYRITYMTRCIAFSIKEGQITMSDEVMSRMIFTLDPLWRLCQIELKEMNTI